MACCSTSRSTGRRGRRSPAPVPYRWPCVLGVAWCSGGRAQGRRAADLLVPRAAALEQLPSVSVGDNSTMIKSSRMRIAVVVGGLNVSVIRAGRSGGRRHGVRAEPRGGHVRLRVVFSDRTLAAIHDADPVLREALAEHGRHWDDIEVRLKGERIRCGGNGMAAISAGRCSSCCGRRPGGRGAAAVQPGGHLTDSTGTTSSWPPTERVDDPYRLADDPVPAVETATAKFIWFGTDYLFDGLTFVHERGPHGMFAVHGYPISAEVSTFIVETDEASWRAAGLDEFDITQPPGPATCRGRQYLEKLFAERIDGRRLLVNNSRWGNFRTRRPRRWSVLGRGPSPARRCRAHRALLGGFRHEDGDGGRDRPGRGSGRTPATCPPPWWPTSRPRGRRWRRSRTRPGPAWPGGSTSGATTTTSRRGSSPTTSCPAASPTPGSRAGTRSSSRPATSGGSPPTGPSRWRRR